MRFEFCMILATIIYFLVFACLFFFFIRLRTKRDVTGGQMIIGVSSTWVLAYLWALIIIYVKFDKHEMLLGRLFWIIFATLIFGVTVTGLVMFYRFLFNRAYTSRKQVIDVAFLSSIFAYVASMLLIFED